MRIEGGAAAREACGAEGVAARFRAALARAGAGDDRAAGSGDAAGAARPMDRRAAAGARGPGAAARGAGDDRAAGSGDAGATAAAPGPPLPAPPPEPGPVPELAGLARVLAPAVAVLGTAPGAPLALSFGRSLEVELRATPAGVEVVLRPEPALARAAAAELPRLVAALRVRGIAVASAAVRARGPGGARVDAGRGLR